MIDEETELLSAVQSRSLTCVLLLMTFAAAIVASVMISVEITSLAEGRIEPAGHVREVRSIIPGRISEVYVQNGDQVETGAPLLKIDDVSAKASVMRLQTLVEDARQALARQRVLHQSLGLDGPQIASLQFEELEFLTATQDRALLLAPESRRLVAAELREYEAELALIDRRHRTALAAAGALDARTNRMRTELQFAKERLARAENLVARGTLPETKLEDAEETVQTLASDVAVSLREYAEAERAAAEIAAEREFFIATATYQHLNKQAELALNLKTLESELEAARGHLDATLLLAPFSGVVDGIGALKVGGTIDSFDLVAKVVPSSQHYVIRGEIPTDQAGFIETGQTVRINLDAFPAQRFGFVYGTLDLVGADSKTEGDTSVFSFTASLKPLPEGSRLSISSGMTAKVNMISGTRSLASYLFAPIVDVFQNGLRER